MESIINEVCLRLKLKAEDVTAALYENGELKDNAHELLGDMIAGRLEKIKTEQIGRGTRTGYAAIRDFAEEVGFENAEKLEGKALLDAVKAFYEAKNEAGKGDLTPEKIRANEVFRRVLDEELAAARKLNQDLRAELDAEKNRGKFEELQNRKKALLIAGLESAGVQFTSEAQKDAIARLLGMDKIGLEGEKLVKLRDDGTVEKDDFGQPLEVIADAVKLHRDLFGITEPGSPQPDPKKKEGGGDGKLSFDSLASFNEFMASTTDLDQRAKALEWRKANLEIE